MTISKLLRPESIAKVKALAASGVRLEVKRCKPAQYPELEQRLYEEVGKGERVVTKSEIFEMAQKVACEMMITDMDIGNNWCTRFIDQHDLVVNLHHSRLGHSIPLSSWFPADSNDSNTCTFSEASGISTPSPRRLSPEPPHYTSATFFPQHVPFDEQLAEQLYQKESASERWPQVYLEHHHYEHARWLELNDNIIKIT